MIFRGGKLWAFKLRHQAQVLAASKAAVLNGNPDVALRAARSFASILNSRATADKLASVVAGRVAGDINHSDASEQLIELVPLIGHRVPASALFAVASLSQSVGCFIASHSFEVIARERHREEGLHGALVDAIASRDIERAEHVWAGSSPSAQRSALINDIAHYLWLWSDGAFGREWDIPPSPWSELIGQSNVLVVGPAPVTDRPPQPINDYLIARVIAPGVTRWPENSFGGRCELAYANNKSTKWFLTQQDRETFAQYRYSSFRTNRWQPLGITNGRTAFSHKELLPMPWDKTNMVPMIVWDLLKAKPKSVHVTGANFFASQKAYTAHEARFKAEDNASTNQAGSTGKRFERCVSFSNHALTQHLSLVANLASSGAVTMDAEGRSVAAMKDTEYLAVIDELYGAPEV